VAEGDAKPKTSTRDHAVVAQLLAPWLERALGADEPPAVRALSGPSRTGMSSETVLIDTDVAVEGVHRSLALVIRLPPPADAFPVFPDYDLGRQAKAMRFVRASSSVPVPDVVGYESDPDVLGAPFLVMERIDGVVAPDVMPYPFGSWLSEASSDVQRDVQNAAIGVLAGLHGIGERGDALSTFALPFDGDTSLRRHVEQQRRYYDWVRRGRTFPAVERAFSQLERAWPSEGGDVLSWGDARVGNILWRDAAPVAVLDWESVAIAPREVDLGWMVFFHEYFQASARKAGLEGMPSFMRRSDAETTYAALTGHNVGDFDWFLLYAALRQALVSIRVLDRAVMFGEMNAPENHEDLIMQRPMLESLTAGTYTWT
jgi:aminoglycoside phosphotransferase (APT) family kinase protein